MIVADALTQTYLEPITDARDYLRRAHLGVLRVDFVCCCLVDDWVSRN